MSALRRTLSKSASTVTTTNSALSTYTREENEDNGSSSLSDENKGWNSRMRRAVHTSSVSSIISFQAKDLFRLNEVGKTTTAATTEKLIHVQRSFAPTSPLARCFKIFISGWTLHFFLQCAMEAKGWFFMAYLTHWTLFMALLYLLGSLALSLCLLSQTIRRNDSNGNATSSASTVVLPGLAVRVVWTLFVIAAPAQMVVCLLFWVLEYNPRNYVLSYATVMRHGGVMLLVLVEGFIINRIPIRRHQIVFPLGYFCVYLSWTLIHDLATDIGNPFRNHPNNPDIDDDAIYGSINWKKRPQKTLITAMASLLIVFPALFGVAWMISWWGGGCCCSRSSTCQLDGSNRQYYDATSSSIDDGLTEDNRNNENLALTQNAEDVLRNNTTADKGQSKPLQQQVRTKRAEIEMV